MLIPFSSLKLRVTLPSNLIAAESELACPTALPVNFTLPAMFEVSILFAVLISINGMFSFMMVWSLATYDLFIR